MALSGRVTTTSKEGRSVTLKWSATQSIPANKSTVSWTLEGSGSASGYVIVGELRVTINGKQAYYRSSDNHTNCYVGTRLASGSVDIAHANDGTKTFAIKVEAGIYNWSINSTGSGSFTLDKIPRYATASQSLKSKTETTITMNWSSDSTIDYIWYSTDGGAHWGAVGYANARSGTYTITKSTSTGGNLTANTAYSVITRVRRKDSQLTSNSAKLSATTEQYPYCKTAPDFKIGDALSLTFHNPLNRTFTFYIVANGTEIANNWTISGTSYTGICAVSSQNQLYATIPNAQSATYKVRVVYGASEQVKQGGTFSIRGNEIPDFNGLTYYDSNATTLAVTGNNQQIVQGLSTLNASFPLATATHGAGSIAKYIIECNGARIEKTATTGTSAVVSVGVVNSSENVNLKVSAIDSRGLSTAQTVTVTMLSHGIPSANVTLERVNNYEDEAYLKVNGSVSSIDGKNTMIIKYRYKQLGGEYGEFSTTADNQKNTFTLSKENVYVFNVVVTDAFGTSFTGEYVLNKGVFPLFIDTEKNSVGVNCFPNNDNALEVDGLISANSVKCKNLLYTPYTESNKLSHTATQDGQSVTTGYYCLLEKGKKYTFSCKTNGVWGGGSGTDTVQAALLKDKADTTYITVTENPATFTPTATGAYYLRYDVNKNGETHTFWDFQVEEGSVATDYAEAKQLEHKDRYFLGEHQVGVWIDGKPIYRNIVSLQGSQFGTEQTTTGQNINIPHNIPQIDKIVKIEDIWLTNAQFRKFPTNYYGNAGWDGQYFATKTDLCFELNANVYNRLIANTTYLYIILYYTKSSS